MTYLIAGETQHCAVFGRNNGRNEVPTILRRGLFTWRPVGLLPMVLMCTLDSVFMGLGGMLRVSSLLGHRSGLVR